MVVTDLTNQSQCKGVKNLRVFNPVDVPGIVSDSFSLIPHIKFSSVNHSLTKPRLSLSLQMLWELVFHLEYVAESPGSLS